MIIFYRIMMPYEYYNLESYLSAKADRQMSAKADRQE